MPNSWSFANQPRPVQQTRAAPASVPVEAPPAGAADAPVVEQYQPSLHTVDEVKDYVGTHPDELEAVLALEEIGKKRSTLIAWLNELLASYLADEAQADAADDAPVDSDG
jgi:hypothetical protein